MGVKGGANPKKGGKPGGELMHAKKWKKKKEGKAKDKN